MEIKNAKIQSTFLGIEDHGIFTAMITLDYGESSQGFGNHDLTYRDYGIKYLRKILEVVGVDCWEELKGKHVRVKSDGHIYSIGHIIEDKWFEPEGSKKG
jgi:hypothetical protein